MILTIFFETPFGNINKILFPTKDKKVIEGILDVNKNEQTVNKKELVYSETESVRKLTD